MSHILTEVDAWVLVVVLAAVMLAALAVASWRGRSLNPEEAAGNPAAVQRRPRGSIEPVAGVHVFDVAGTARTAAADGGHGQQCDWRLFHMCESLER